MENLYRPQPYQDTALIDPILERPTLADTAHARFMNGVFRSAINLADEVKGQEYDPNFDVKKFIADNGYTGPLAAMINYRGSSSEADARKQIEYWENYYAPAQRTLSDSSTANMIATDPVLLTSVLWPFALPARTVNTLRVGAELRRANLAKEVLGKQPLTYTEIATLEAAVLDGTINMRNALQQIEEGVDAEDALLSAGIYTSMSIAAAGAVGKGFDQFGTMAAQKRKQRVDAFNNGMREWVEASRKRTEAGQEPAEFDFTAKWFTDSPIFKAIPTPMKSILNNKDLPQWFKLETLKLANDSGLMLALNQSGNTVGNSVWQRAARRNGDWFRAYESAREAWSQMNPRGGAQFANVEVQNAAEIMRKRLGKESVTIDDFMESLGRTYILRKGDELSQIERQALDSIHKYFMDAYDELNELGFLRTKGLKSYRMNVEGRVNKDVEFYEQVFGSALGYVGSRQLAIRNEIVEKMAIFNDLDDVFQARGLTKKQQALYDKLPRQIDALEVELDDLTEIMNRMDNIETVDDMFKLKDYLRTTAKQDKVLRELEKRIEKQRDVLDELKAREAATEDSLINWFPRFWNRKRIAEDREGLHAILSKHFKENPRIISFNPEKKIFEKIELDDSAEAVSQRADEVIDAILGETDDEIIETITMGKGKHFQRRGLDIPNELVVDYIQTNVRDVMIAYSDRISPRVEFQRTFAGFGKMDEKASKATGEPMQKLVKFEDLDKGLRDMLKSDGVSEDVANAAMRDFTVLYDRVVGTVIKNPDSISRKTVNWLKTVTSWTYLGAAGVSAVADVGALFMDHEARNVAKGLAAMWDDVDAKMVRREVQLAGEAMDIVKNLSHARHMETLSRDVFNDLPDKVNNFFYTANGLGPVTVATKTLDGLVRGHTIIEASIRKATGEASQFEIEFLARYNISDLDAKNIADLATQKGSPIEQTNNGLFLPNTDMWDNDYLVDVFRNALRSGVANRIIMAGPADKPIMMDGVAYIPMSIASKFGMQEDELVKGYARYENAFLSLPFTFYTYTLGAANKITANYAQGAVRSKAMHFAVAMGLGYGIVKYKTPDWKWKEMDMEDKIFRAFDFSGLAAIYSDMTYRGLEMAQSFGADDMLIEPRFKQKPDPVGGIVSLAGAPADYAYDGYKALREFMSGDFSDGAKQVGRMVPFSNLIVGGDQIKSAVDGIAGSLPNRP